LCDNSTAAAVGSGLLNKNNTTQKDEIQDETKKQSKNTGAVQAAAGYTGRGQTVYDGNAKRVGQ
jgi:hypothetical protein